MKSEFGQRLRLMRTRAKLTQESVANVLGVNRSTYAKYETGENEPDHAMLQKLADFFGTTTDELLGRTSPFLLDKERLIKKIENISNDNSSVSPEEAEFLRWVDENMEDADVFFYDFHKSPEEQKRQFIETMRALWEVEKKRGNIKPKE